MTQELSKNTHYWAVVSGKAAVVLWDGEVFRIAGDWEGPVKVDRVVCRVAAPKELIGMNLYYGGTIEED